MHIYEKFNTHTGLGEPQSSTVSRASQPGVQARDKSRYPRTPKGNNVVDDTIDTQHLGTDPFRAQNGKNGLEKTKNLSVPMQAEEVGHRLGGELPHEVHLLRGYQHPLLI